MAVNLQFILPFAKTPTRRYNSFWKSWQGFTKFGRYPGSSARFIDFIDNICDDGVKFKLMNTVTNRHNQNSANKFSRPLLIVLLIIMVVAVLVAAWVYLSKWPQLIKFIAIIIALVGFYPLTYLAYLRFEARAQEKNLKVNFQLLGLVSKDELDDTVESLYRTIYSPNQFIIYTALIVLTAILVTVGYFGPEQTELIDPATMKLVFYGFLGAHIFSIQQLSRRYNTFDLQPQVYSSILVRMLVAMAVTFVGASMLQLSVDQSNTTADPQTWSAVLAFVIGLFPDSGLHWLTQQARRIIDIRGQEANARPLNKIIGMSVWHEARLAEIGIDDAQNLAACDLKKLLLMTRFNTEMIVNWVDQAILYVKIGDKIDRFREAKITTFHQFRTELNQLAASTNNATQSGNGSGPSNRDKLSAVLGLSDTDELERIANDADYPNYSFIMEYYSGIAHLAHQQANVGVDNLTGDYHIYALQGISSIASTQQKSYKPSYPPSTARQCVKVGNNYYREGQYPEALETYTKAIKLDPELPVAYTNRSLVHIVQQNYEQAIRDCAQAISVERTYAPAYNNRALAYMSMGYTDQAIKDTNEALRLDDRLADAYYNRGLAHNARSHFVLATKDFERAYLLNYRTAGFWLSWGVALLGLTDYDDAIEKLSQAILQKDSLAQAYAHRGYAYLSLGPDFFPQAELDLNKALTYYQKENDAASAKEGEAARSLLTTIYNSFGLLKAHQDDYPTAAAYYQQAVALDPSCYTARFNLALAYDKQNLITEAQNEFQTILQTAPASSTEVKEAGEYLQRLNDKRQLESEKIELQHQEGSVKDGSGQRHPDELPQ